MARSPLGARAELKGPVGERNVYTLRPAAEWPRSRRAKAASSSRSGRSWRLATTPSSTPRKRSARFRVCRRNSPSHLARRGSIGRARPRLALLEGDEAATAEASLRLASRAGPIVRLEALSSARLDAGEDYDLAGLVRMRGRDQHRGGGRQCEPDDNRLGCREPSPQNAQRRASPNGSTTTQSPNRRPLCRSSL